MAAFASPFNPVYTVLRVRNTGEQVLDRPSAVYRIDGGTIEATVTGAEEIPAGQTRTFEVRAITPKGFGGTVHLKGEVEVSIPVVEPQSPAASTAGGAGSSDTGAKEGGGSVQD